MVCIVSVLFKCGWLGIGDSWLVEGLPRVCMIWFQLVLVLCGEVGVLGVLWLVWWCCGEDLYCFCIVQVWV